MSFYVSNSRHRYFGFLWAALLLSIVGTTAFGQLALGPKPGELPACIKSAQWSKTPIPRDKLAKAQVAVKTDQGHFGLLDVKAGDAIKVTRLVVYSSDGRRVNGASNVLIRSSYALDVDSARISSNDADLQWHAQSIGQQRLVPLNGAEISLCSGARGLFRSGNQASLFGETKRGEMPNTISGAQRLPTLGGMASAREEKQPGSREKPVVSDSTPRSRVNGYYCVVNNQCRSGYCADSQRCAPRDGSGRDGEYCHHNNHCSSGSCVCPENAQENGFCKNFSDYTPAQVADRSRRNGDFQCRPKAQANKKACNSDAVCGEYGECVSYRCRTKAEYKHVEEHSKKFGRKKACVSNIQCSSDEFCDRKTSFCIPKSKTAQRTELGGECFNNSQCSSGYCADKRRCAPRDGTGQGGEYCHHNNHCKSGQCECPRGESMGFCWRWETGNNVGQCK